MPRCTCPLCAAFGPPVKRWNVVKALRDAFEADRLRGAFELHVPLHGHGYVMYRARTEP